MFTSAIIKSGHAAENAERLRLFCFPHAGSGSSSFRGWRGAFGDAIEVVPIALPGRERRFADKIPPTLDHLVSDLADSIAPQLDVPFALLGHSMGGLIAFELARLLRRRRLAEPRHLFISAHRAPHLPASRRPIHHLPDALLRSELLRLKGTPFEVLRDSELLQILLPVLRADLRICETYVYRQMAPLTCAVTCLCGIADRRVSRVQMVAWKRHTVGPFRLRLFAGGHFYLYENPELVGKAVAADLDATRGELALKSPEGRTSF